jgi:exo-beta-1,3-glucanase (GH17 family)
MNFQGPRSPADHTGAAGVLQGPGQWLPYRLPFLLFALSLGIIAAVWYWLGAPVQLAHPIGPPGAKINCVSYAPFRGSQNPIAPYSVVGEREIAEDFAQLATVSRCVRSYSTGNGMDKAPGIARKFGLKMMLGIWVSGSAEKTRGEIETAVALAKEYPDVVEAIIVGSEVLLRKEITAAELRRTIRSVKAQVSVPITYADVWEFWFGTPDLADVVDFVTIHVIPFWEDVPVSAEVAVEHVERMRQRAIAAFPGKEILIGETGWPSAGRMREGTLPSRIDQARFISGALALAEKQKFRLNLIEAFDQPWKHEWEGTVGEHWGLFDAQTRAFKYPAGEAISNQPFWERHVLSGFALCSAVFGAAMLALLRNGRPARQRDWFAVAIMATTSGALLGVAIEAMFLNSFGIDGWIREIVLLALGVSVPLLSAYALMSGYRIPAFGELLGSADYGPLSRLSVALGGVLALTAVMACITALGLVFDPRCRDFPFAPMTMAAISFFALRTSRTSHDALPMSEMLFAALLGSSAIYIVFNEGFGNWQSLWTCAAYALLGATLLRGTELKVQSSLIDVSSLTLETAPQTSSQTRLGG